MAPPPDEVYATRLAVLLVAMLPASGTDEARGSVGRAAATALDVLRASGGEAEPLAPDRVVSAFDEAVTAVQAGFRLQDRLAADVATSGVRIGIHAADVVATGEGLALGAAIAAASSLAARGTVGALVVSPEVARAAEEALAVTVRALEPAPDQPRAVLLFPAEAGAHPWPRRQVVGGIAAAVVVGGVVGAVILGRRPQVSHATLTVGVMPFKGVTEDLEHVWLREALRDGLNTQLSPLVGVKVYSREFLDFLVTRQGLSEYEAATKLGIGKLLSGSVGVVGNVVRVEAQVVDITSGTVESSVLVIGHEEALVALQSDLARALIDRLGLSLTAADARRLESYRATDLEGYRRVREADGEATVGAPPVGPGDDPPRGPSGWLAPRSAWADEQDVARAEITAFLDRYRRAIEARDVDTLAAFYIEFPPEQRAAIARFFTTARDLRVTLEDVDVAVVGDEAIVSYSRTDDFIDVPTGRPMHVMTRPTKLLQRKDAAWRLAPGR